MQKKWDFCDFNHVIAVGVGCVDLSISEIISVSRVYTEFLPTI